MRFWCGAVLVTAHELSYGANHRLDIAVRLLESEIEKKMDPETEFLASKRMSATEWETFKENVRPLKRGRNVNLLNNALLSHTDNNLKNHLIQQRRKLIQAIDEYQGRDPLLPWLHVSSGFRRRFLLVETVLGWW